MKNNFLSFYAVGKDNNFNLLRFFAATLVLFSHSFALSIGHSSAEPLYTSLGVTFGSMAVDIFFITSGFLVTASLLNRGNIFAFVWARFLRIYPALLVSVTFCVFIVGLYFTSLPYDDYLGDYEIYRFFVKNIILLDGIDYSLPGVFENIPYRNAVNGSLWTLPFELKAYILLALIGTVYLSFKDWIKRVLFESLLVLMGLVGMSLYMIDHYIPIADTMTLKLFSMFFIGSAYYILKDKIIISKKFFWIIAIIIGLSTYDKEIFFITYTLGIAYMVLYFSYVPSGQIRRFNKFGDYSYGLYIYAFPIQQSVAALIPNVSVLEMFVFSFSVTLILSVLSWHFVEKRFLNFKDKYIVVQNLVTFEKK